MAIRVRLANLKDVFPTDMNDVALQLHLTAASRVVDTITGLSDNTLHDIEMYLAAHFASTTDPRAQSENVGREYQYSVQGKTDMGLDSTFFGQQAQMLDTTGTLAELADPKEPARFEILDAID